MIIQDQSVTEDNHIKTRSRMSFNDSMVSKTKSQLADQLKSKFVKKYGRDASPTIEHCVN